MAFWQTRLARSRLACVRGLATLPHVGGHPGVPYMAAFTGLILLAVLLRLAHLHLVQDDAISARGALVGGAVALLMVALPLWGVVLYGAQDRARLSDKIRVEERINRVLRAVTEGVEIEDSYRAWSWTVAFQQGTPQVEVVDARTKTTVMRRIPTYVWDALPHLLDEARVVDGRCNSLPSYSTMILVRTIDPPSAHRRLERTRRIRSLLEPGAIAAIDRAMDG